MTCSKHELNKVLHHQILSAALVLQVPGTSVHWYGKEVQNKRKLGHITITGADNQEAHQRLHSIDSVAADAMAAASDRYTEATSSAQESQGGSSCALKSAVMAGRAVQSHSCICLLLLLLSVCHVCGCCVSLCCLYWFVCLSFSLPVSLSVLSYLDACLATCLHVHLDLQQYANFSSVQSNSTHHTRSTAVLKQMDHSRQPRCSTQS